MKPTKAPKPRKKPGPATEVDRQVVAAVVMDTPGPLSLGQELSLARTLRRTPEMIRDLVNEARENFVAAAKDYVEVHKVATLGALASGDFETALKGSQWAMQNIAGEGARIVDKATGEAAGTKIMIGIQMGSMAPAVKVEGA